MYPHTNRGMAPGGGKGPGPPGGRGPPADKPVDEMEDEEDEEGDTDEETVSVTSSSQDSTDKLRYQKWGEGGPIYRPSAGVHQKIQMTLQGGKVVKEAVGDLGAIGGREEELDPQGRMESLDL